MQQFLVPDIRFIYLFFIQGFCALVESCVLIFFPVNLQKIRVSNCIGNSSFQVLGSKWVEKQSLDGKAIKKMGV